MAGYRERMMKHAGAFELVQVEAVPIQRPGRPKLRVQAADRIQVCATLKAVSQAYTQRGCVVGTIQPTTVSDTHLGVLVVALVRV